MSEEEVEYEKISDLDIEQIEFINSMYKRRKIRTTKNDEAMSKVVWFGYMIMCILQERCNWLRSTFINTPPSEFSRHQADNKVRYTTYMGCIEIISSTIRDIALVYPLVDDDTHKFKRKYERRRNKSPLVGFNQED